MRVPFFCATLSRKSIIKRDPRGAVDKTKKGPPLGDPFKNQVLNYFLDAYMKYLNPSGLAKKPSILSLHIKISV